MATKCVVCNGRTIKTETGVRCMNSSCEGANEATQNKKEEICKCGDVMDYRGLDTYGAPHYTCQACGEQRVL